MSGSIEPHAQFKIRRPSRGGSLSLSARDSGNLVWSAALPRLGGADAEGDETGDEELGSDEPDLI